MRRCSVLHGFLLLAAMFASPFAESAEIEVGVAVSDITPPLGYRMAGYFAERANTGTKDPLLAKAIVFRSGDTEAALVFCDLIGIPRYVSQRAREIAEARTGIRPDHIAICATHSHTGPLFHGVLRRHFHEKAIAAAKGNDPREVVNYEERLVTKLADLIGKAHEARVPSRLAAGIARQESLSFNRRFHMKDGKVVFNPGQKNPNIVKVAGPIDPDVGLIAVRRRDEPALSAALTVFALHLDTVGGTEYSADYPHHLELALREAFGPRFVSLFGAGTCGDINHIDVRTEGRRGAAEIGKGLAQTVLAQVPKLAAIASPSLQIASAVVEVPLQRYSDPDVAEARAKLDQVGTPKLPFLDAVHAVKLVDLKDNYPGGTIGLEVQVFRLSRDVAIVTLPGEVFVDLGLAIKKGSPFPTTLVIELANDVPAYVPTRRAFGEGSYEIVNSRIAAGGGEAMVETATRLLKDLAH